MKVLRKVVALTGTQQLDCLQLERCRRGLNSVCCGLWPLWVAIRQSLCPWLALRLLSA